MTGERTLLGLFVSALAIAGLLVVYPALYAFWLSLHKAESFVSTPVWVGLANYARVLADPELWAALWRGVIFAGCTILLQVLIGIGLAMLLDAAIPLRRIARGFIILPYLLPTLIVALTCKWMLNDPIGIVTVLLKNMGFGVANWLGNERTAMLAVILVSVWMWTPFVTVAFLAGVQNVPPVLYEAARVDGATAWQRFWHITLPQLKPVLTVIVLLRTIWMFNKFDIIWLLTRGGPLHATEHLPVLAYRKAFVAYDVGMGAAICVLSFILLAAVIVMYLRIFPLDGKAE